MRIELPAYHTLARRALALVWAILPCCLPGPVSAEGASSPSKAPQILDGIVAKVNGQPVFLRDMKAEFWLAPDGRVRELKIQDLLGRVIDRKLLTQEAERLKMGTEDPDTLDREVAAKNREIVAKPGGGKGGVSKELVQEWVAQNQAIRVLKEKRIGLLVVVSDQEVDSYYAAHADQFGGVPLESVRAKVADRVYREKFDEQYERWFASLKRRSQMEVFLDEVPWKDFDFKEYFQTPP